MTYINLLSIVHWTFYNLSGGKRDLLQVPHLAGRFLETSIESLCRRLNEAGCDPRNLHDQSYTYGLNVIIYSVQESYDGIHNQPRL